MSSIQTGLSISDELSSTFQEICLSASPVLRALRVVVLNETLHQDASMEGSESWEKDFDSLKSFISTEPCFVLFCFDDKSWIIIQYTPESSKIKDKMLLSASKATLLKSLGDSKFTDSYFATTPDELTLKEYRLHTKQKQISALSAQEKELEIVEHRDSVGTTTNVFNAGISIQVNPTAQAAVQRFCKGSQLLVFKIANECLDVYTEAEQMDIDAVRKTVEQNGCVYLLYRVKDLIVFAMTCPSVAKVKERMIYSSSRGSVLTFLENNGITIAKKFEFDDLSDFTKEHIMDSLFPKSEPESSTPSMRLKFAKPARPGKK